MNILFVTQATKGRNVKNMETQFSQPPNYDRRLIVLYEFLLNLSNHSINIFMSVY